ncbi:hypothetical protein [Leptolyngbya sp. 7M]|uniref:hypothetical protein n=1 Tax=Leptolyngbya sp. 7M TaxID=2812896 RepID=UPI001B8B8D4C|nr:hypothetical protein [Leptolyngbya sp. 7M]QYO66600.1 hypothetical protein JVX88_07305 [Leptolyngbya sp. 7M]
MINIAMLLKKSSIAFMTAGLLLILGGVAETAAQRDPFMKPGWARTKEPGKVGTRTGPAGEKAPEFVPGIPSIEQRIEYFKRIREDAAANGQPLPKVTSVLALNEMQVTGIFRTPRGYAAMVEATPIRLTYTIYPGERFFDGQLVAVEENRLVFRKVTKVGKDKFTTTVENKPLRKYTQREQIQGTAPAGSETATKGSEQPAAPTAAALLPSIVSPLDEMNRQAGSSPTKASEPAKRPTRVARRKN